MAMESISYIQDGSLVRQAQSGNQAAFAQLVHTYDQTVLRLALRLTGSESDAQDIHQEAFLRVYKKLDGFRFECSFATWIYRIVTNVCLDHLRRNQARKKNGGLEVSDDEFLDQLSDDRPGGTPEQQLLDRELNAQILRALERLTPRERMVFDLKYFQGLKLRNVSEILNASEASVNTTMKNCCDKAANQRQKPKRLMETATLAATANNPMSERRPPTLDRILILQGNSTFQRTLRELFCSEGYEVDLVPDGLAGLEMLRQTRPSAVIVNLQHSGSSGSDLCKRIANLIPSLPLVVLGASSEVAEKVLLLEAGADDYVTVPFSSRELVARLRALIRRTSRISLEDLHLDEAACL
jgi:RNA polymerase sigma-70 factor (ECF subfamily)